MTKYKYLDEAEFIRLKTMLNVGVPRKMVIEVSHRSHQLVDEIRQARDFADYKQRTQSYREALARRKAGSQPGHVVEPIVDHELLVRLDRIEEKVDHLLTEQGSSSAMPWGQK